MTQQMTPAKIELLEEACVVFSKDGNNQISCGDIGKVLRAIGCCPAEVELKNIIDKIDRSGNKKLSVKEIVQIISSNPLPTENKEELKDAFRVFDKDGNGYVSAAELRHVLTNLGEKLSDEEVDELIRAADLTPDGMVSYEDFVRILHS